MALRTPASVQLRYLLISRNVAFAPEKSVTPLALESVQAFESGAVWLRYKVK